jgi:hypothetical protein
VPGRAATGKLRGHDGVRDFFADIAEHVETLQTRCPDVRDLGDLVLALGTARVVGKGSGIDLEGPLTVVARSRDGRITRGGVRERAEAVLRECAQVPLQRNPQDAGPAPEALAALLREGRVRCAGPGKAPPNPKSVRSRPGKQPPEQSASRARSALGPNTSVTADKGGTFVQNFGTCVN